MKRVSFNQHEELDRVQGQPANLHAGELVARSDPSRGTFEVVLTFDSGYTYKSDAVKVADFVLGRLTGAGFQVRLWPPGTSRFTGLLVCLSEIAGSRRSDMQLCPAHDITTRRTAAGQLLSAARCTHRQSLSHLRLRGPRQLRHERPGLWMSNQLSVRGYLLGPLSAGIVNFASIGVTSTRRILRPCEHS